MHRVTWTISVKDKPLKHIFLSQPGTWIGEQTLRTCLFSGISAELSSVLRVLAFYHISVSNYKVFSSAPIIREAAIAGDDGMQTREDDSILRPRP